MTAEELKEEITLLVNEAPDEILENLLIYIQELTSKSISDALVASHVNQILLEDTELLRKLSE